MGKKSVKMRRVPGDNYRTFTEYSVPNFAHAKYFNDK